MENLLSARWEPLVSDKGLKNWLVKFLVTNNNSYTIAVSDSSTVFLESLNKEEIAKTFTANNSRLEAPVESVIAHLQQSVKQQSDFTTSAVSPYMLLLELSNNFRHDFPFYWTFHCSSKQENERLSATKQLLSRPLITTLSRLMFENSLLQEALKKKDAEIADYKENGAHVTRLHLETVPYIPEKFRNEISQIREYAEAITKDSLLVLCDSSLNEIMSSTVLESTSDKTLEILSTHTGSPQKPITSALFVKHSPNKSKLSKRRKLQKPAHRGVHLIEDDEEASLTNSNK